jgi:DNA-directed RNA polymerase specialized sigma24 family protein
MLQGLRAGPKSDRVVVFADPVGWADLDHRSLARRLLRGLDAGRLPRGKAVALDDLAEDEQPSTEATEQRVQPSHDVLGVVGGLPRRERELAWALAFGSARTKADAGRQMGIAPATARVLAGRTRRRLSPWASEVLGRAPRGRAGAPSGRDTPQ